jgi:hypothetical protein
MALNVEPGITQGRSPSSSAPVGTSVVTMIECGEGYTSNELYDVTITVTEIVRGEKASSLVGGAPKAGSEYILAHMRVEYLARGLPGKCSHELKLEQFTAFSADGREYKAPSVPVPKPALGGNLHSGKSMEGWAAFSVAQDDRRPLMTFTADPTGAAQHGGNIWFQLY